MKLGILFLVLAILSGSAYSGCLDNLSSSMVVNSKIRGFYINRDMAGESQIQTVILDKATCTASNSDTVVLASSTKSHYYLNFRSSDKTLYATLLSAQARDIVVKFRIAPPLSESNNTNSILYVISPADAGTQ